MRLLSSSVKLGWGSIGSFVVMSFWLGAVVAAAVVAAAVVAAAVVGVVVVAAALVAVVVVVAVVVGVVIFGVDVAVGLERLRPRRRPLLMSFKRSIMEGRWAATSVHTSASTSHLDATFISMSDSGICTVSAKSTPVKFT